MSAPTRVCFCVDFSVAYTSILVGALRDASCVTQGANGLAPWKILTLEKLGKRVRGRRKRGCRLVNINVSSCPTLRKTASRLAYGQLTVLGNANTGTVVYLFVARPPLLGGGFASHDPRAGA